MKGFNPYFTGYTTFTVDKILKNEKIPEGMFQSLFYWIYYFYHLSFTNIGDDYLGVSILILLDILLLLWSFNRIRPCRRKFQSLFYWIYYFYPYFCENPLFISVTDFFSDIKITIFELIFIIFCSFFSIFRNF